ncbi:MAG: hypothetical protein EB150_01855 [Nitrososphaeria archaeon]|nr:hypothetical protein [Nitrososphaeria archaeon]NDB50755.1 hypothetical protein [Nitrosopumilaceae archaeon]NDB88270.1 hypothetical protein [Nitrososphaerota archaeon]NDB47274.1 hypothetical protein [Nitrososphaeria archaeon]NDB63068.1 hypothetical protein [Nitrosopumilaceae archaeon]
MAKQAMCKRCQQKFEIKYIYTIQQFQYRKTPPYQWTVEFFAKQNIGEWDSFCESCIIHYQKISLDEFESIK